MISVLYGGVCFILLMIVAPMIVGRLVCSNTRITLGSSRAYQFVIGFFSLLGIWALMVLPFSLWFPKHPFHEIRYAYLGTIITICAAGILYESSQKHKIKEPSSEYKSDTGNKLYQSITAGYRIFIQNVKSKIKTLIGSKANRIYMAVILAIVFFQIFETSYYAPVGYVNDDLYYYNHINDTVYMDQLYARTADGAIPEADKASIIYTTGYKLIVNQWFSFISFLSATTGIHSLILCRTLLPVYIIVVLYIMLYAFGIFIYPENRTKRLCYLICAALIFEALSYSYYLFFLTLYITTYGKQIAGIIGVPLLLLSLYVCTKEKNRDSRSILFECLLLFFVSAGVVSMGVSALSSGALAFFFMSIVIVFRIRKIKTLAYIAVAAIPFLIQLMTFISVGGRAVVTLSPR